MNDFFQTYPWLKNGLSMTLYTALRVSQTWEQTITEPAPQARSECVFLGAAGVPIFGTIAKKDRPRGTIIGTYGITGDINNQWYLKILERKAIARNYAVVLFDWRAHGKTAQLSPTLTSDGLYEGEDFVRIAAQAKAMGCPPPYWFVGYSLGGQLALWAAKAAQTIELWGRDLGLKSDEIGGTAVICPNLDSNRSLPYLESHPLGRYIEKAIAKELKKLAQKIYQAHPQDIDPEAIARANSIRGFDRELVVSRLGFSSPEEYYDACNALKLLPHLKTSTLILYAADDPMFAPAIVPDLQAACANNPAIDLILTVYGGHVGYFSNRSGQRLAADRDRWWAWNRILEWCDRESPP
jgi:predicted alpha/beta-fold hydrolase